LSRGWRANRSRCGGSDRLHPTDKILAWPVPVLETQRGREGGCGEEEVEEEKISEHCTLTARRHMFASSHGRKKGYSTRDANRRRSGKRDKKADGESRKISRAEEGFKISTALAHALAPYRRGKISGEKKEESFGSEFRSTDGVEPRSTNCLRMNAEGTARAGNQVGRLTLVERSNVPRETCIPGEGKMKVSGSERGDTAHLKI